MKNEFQYKWSRLFASKRFNSKTGTIKLTVHEQQELLDDAGIFSTNKVSYDNLSDRLKKSIDSIDNEQNLLK